MNTFLKIFVSGDVFRRWKRRHESSAKKAVNIFIENDL